MTLKNVSLVNFRSYRFREFDLNSSINLVIGPNGSGKTNFLEAIYTLANLRSFKSQDKDLLNHGQDEYRVQGVAQDNNYHLIYTNGKQKRIFHNQTKVAVKDHLGSLPAVLFEPSHLLMIYGSPEDRRRYLNEVLSTMNPSYLQALIRYRKVLKQRNNLLRYNKNPVKQIFIWDFKLAEYASFLVSERLRLIGFLNQNIVETYRHLTGQKVPILLTYSNRQNNYSAWLLNQLEQNLNRDRQFGFTTVGPHRDDMLIKFKNKPVSQVASRGEVRSIVLACKFLELKFKEQRTGSKPILLFDDVFSELDEERKQYVLKNLAGYQTIITTTEPESKLIAILPKEHAIIRIGNNNG